MVAFKFEDLKTFFYLCVCRLFILFIQGVIEAYLELHATGEYSI